jgi:3-oxo-5-alpha-steroid 4-dehydrogenase 1
MGIATFHFWVWIWIVIALVLIPVQLKITAPYGRHTRNNWGPMIDNRLGWMIMEIVSPLAFAYFFLKGNISAAGNYLFFSLWMIHYLNRSFIFPLRTKTTGKKIPIVIVCSAIFFNSINGSINGYFFGNIESYTGDWFVSVNFWIGIVLFLIGFIINQQADHILLNLRKGEERGYKIPFGSLFKWISCPNHFGEIIEWIGFAVMAWSLSAFSFAIWTAANLIPRALSHHLWYQEHFEDYPEERKAVIPFLI